MHDLCVNSQAGKATTDRFVEELRLVGEVLVVARDRLAALEVKVDAVELDLAELLAGQKFEAPAFQKNRQQKFAL
jgi:BMFP domain-containing protein YqiC